MNKSHSVFQRLITSFCLVTFTVTQFVSFPQSGYAAPLGQTDASAAVALQVGKLEIPAEIGKAEEFYQGTSDQTVLLIQDAHAVPDAQKNISSLIDFFQKKYGVRKVGVEGAASRFDTQFFKSFPDQEPLKKVVDSYVDRGELGGAAAHALLNCSDTMIYEGVEDGALYERGLGLYLLALEQKEALDRQLKTIRADLEARKNQTWPQKLLDIDLALESFYKNQTDLAGVLQKLSEIQQPEKDSELEALLREIRKETTTHSSLDAEVRKAASAIERALKRRLSGAPVGRSKPEVGRAKQNQSFTPSNLQLLTSNFMEFNAKLQAFQTSQMSAEAFALYLKETADKLGLVISLSDKLHEGIQAQKQLRDLEGSKLYEDFETYAAQVKQSLFRSEKEAALDLESTELRLLEKLSRLELSPKEWNEIQKLEVGGWRLEGKRKDQEEAVSGKLPTSNFPHQTLFQAHLEFYRNAEARDLVMAENLRKLLGPRLPLRSGGQVSSLLLGGSSRPKNEELRAAVLVVGGFHARALAEQFKKENISYALIRPAMASIPEDTHYSEQMQGRVSWNSSLRIENGTVSPYEGFARAMRDTLIERGFETQSRINADPRKSASVSAPDPLLAKLWRDQILLDLAAKNQMVRSRQYTHFIDELTGGKVSPTSDYLAKLDRFIEGLTKLHLENRVTERNILGILGNTSTSQTPLGVPLASDRLGQSGFLSIISEGGQVVFHPSESLRGEIRSLIRNLVLTVALAAGVTAMVGPLDSLGADGLNARPAPRTIVTTPRGQVSEPVPLVQFAAAKEAPTPKPFVKKKSTPKKTPTPKKKPSSKSLAKPAAKPTQTPTPVPSAAPTPTPIHTPMPTPVEIRRPTPTEALKDIPPAIVTDVLRKRDDNSWIIWSGGVLAAGGFLLWILRSVFFTKRASINQAKVSVTYQGGVEKYELPTRKRREVRSKIKNMPLTRRNFLTVAFTGFLGVGCSKTPAETSKPRSGASETPKAKEASPEIDLEIFREQSIRKLRALFADGLGIEKNSHYPVDNILGSNPAPWTQPTAIGFRAEELAHSITGDIPGESLQDRQKSLTELQALLENLARDQKALGWKGLIPWFKLSGRKVIADRDEIAFVDNANLTLSLVNVIGSLLRAKDAKTKLEVDPLIASARQLIDAQKSGYAEFYDSNRGLFHGARKSSGFVSGYYINRLFAEHAAKTAAICVLFGIDKRAFLGLVPTFRNYTFRDGKSRLVAAPQDGAVFQMSWYAYLISGSERFKTVFENFLKAVLDESYQKGIPGVLSASFVPGGSYDGKIGHTFRETSDSVRTDIGSLYALDALAGLFPESVLEWRQGILEQLPGLDSPYGNFDSVDLQGRVAAGYVGVDHLSSILGLIGKQSISFQRYLKEQGKQKQDAFAALLDQAAGKFPEQAVQDFDIEWAPVPQVGKQKVRQSPSQRTPSTSAVNERTYHAARKSQDAMCEFVNAYVRSKGYEVRDNSWLNDIALGYSAPKEPGRPYSDLVNELNLNELAGKGYLEKSRSEIRMKEAVQRSVGDQVLAQVVLDAEQTGSLLPTTAKLLARLGRAEIRKTDALNGAFLYFDWRPNGRTTPNGRDLYTIDPQSGLSLLPLRRGVFDLEEGELQYWSLGGDQIEFLEQLIGSRGVLEKVTDEVRGKLRADDEFFILGTEGAPWGLVHVISGESESSPVKKVFYLPLAWIDQKVWNRVGDAIEKHFETKVEMKNASKGWNSRWAVEIQPLYPEEPNQQYSIWVHPTTEFALEQGGFTHFGQGYYAAPDRLGLEVFKASDQQRIRVFQPLGIPRGNILNIQKNRAHQLIIHYEHGKQHPIQLSGELSSSAGNSKLKMMKEAGLDALVEEKVGVDQERYTGVYRFSQRGGDIYVFVRNGAVYYVGKEILDSGLPELGHVEIFSATFHEALDGKPVLNREGWILSDLRVLVDGQPWDFDSLIDWKFKKGAHRSESRTAQDQVKPCYQEKGLLAFYQDIVKTFENQYLSEIWATRDAQGVLGWFGLNGHASRRLHFALGSIYPLLHFYPKWKEKFAKPMKIQALEKNDPDYLAGIGLGFAALTDSNLYPEKKTSTGKPLEKALADARKAWIENELLPRAKQGNPGAIQALAFLLSDRALSTDFKQKIKIVLLAAFIVFLDKCGFDAVAVGKVKKDIRDQKMVDASGVLSNTFKVNSAMRNSVLQSGFEAFAVGLPHFEQLEIKVLLPCIRGLLSQKGFSVSAANLRGVGHLISGFNDPNTQQEKRFWIEWLQEQVFGKGGSNAGVALGYAAPGLSPETRSEVIEQLMKLARSGNFAAMETLAWNFTSLTPKDQKSVRELVKSAADRGDASALLSMTHIYRAAKLQLAKSRAETRQRHLAKKHPRPYRQPPAERVVMVPRSNVLRELPVRDPVQAFLKNLTDLLMQCLKKLDGDLIKKAGFLLMRNAQSINGISLVQELLDDASVMLSHIGSDPQLKTRNNKTEVSKFVSGAWEELSANFVIQRRQHFSQFLDVLFKEENTVYSKGQHGQIVQFIKNVISKHPRNSPEYLAALRVLVRWYSDKNVAARIGPLLKNGSVSKVKEAIDQARKFAKNGYATTQEEDRVDLLEALGSMPGSHRLRPGGVEKQRALAGIHEFPSRTEIRTEPPDSTTRAELKDVAHEAAQEIRENGNVMPETAGRIVGCDMPVLIEVLTGIKNVAAAAALPEIGAALNPDFFQQQKAQVRMDQMLGLAREIMGAEPGAVVGLSIPKNLDLKNAPQLALHFGDVLKQMPPASRFVVNGNLTGPWQIALAKGGMKGSKLQPEPNLNRANLVEDGKVLPMIKILQSNLGLLGVNPVLQIQSDVLGYQSAEWSPFTIEAMIMMQYLLAICSASNLEPSDLADAAALRQKLFAQLAVLGLDPNEMFSYQNGQVKVSMSAIEHWIDQARAETRIGQSA